MAAANTMRIRISASALWPKPGFPFLAPSPINCTSNSLPVPRLTALLAVMRLKSVLDDLDLRKRIGDLAAKALLRQIGLRSTCDAGSGGGVVVSGDRRSRRTGGGDHHDR